MIRQNENHTIQKEFLRECAEEIWMKSAGKTDHICLIFPNKRALSFFHKYLAETAGKAIWSPVSLSSGEIIQRNSPLMKADQLTLLADLYEVYAEVTKSDESFDRFMPWGELLLSDFDEIDKYLVKADILYKNLADEKEMSDALDYLTQEQIEAIQRFWRTFGKESDERGSQKFIKVWEKLFEVYSKFKEQIAKKGYAYEGMIQRSEIEKGSGNFHFNEFDQYYFIGFNLLNKCEERLFDWYKKNSNAHFYWDADEYYVNDLSHEAGKFLRKNLKKFPQNRKLGQFFSQDSKQKVNIISVSGMNAQAKFIGQILEKEQFPFSESAIVLPEEQMLFPILNSIPENEEQINITMGLSLASTPLFSLLNEVFKLRKSFGKNKSNKERFYFEPVCALLEHPYLIGLFKDDNREILGKIRELNIIYPHVEMLRLNKFYKLLFSNPKDTSLLSFFQEIVEKLLLNDHKNHVILKEILWFWKGISIRLNDICKNNQLPNDDESIHKIIRQIMRQSKLPFEGEPIAGLQILGTLETRSLDFKNVFIPNMNEGTFPNENAGLTYIPFGLRRAFELPLPEDKSAAQAYYFFRLIQRADNVYLLYNSETEGLKGGEPSRYLAMLELETSLKLNKSVLSGQMHFENESEIVIPKNESVQRILEKYYRGTKIKNISPAAINTYLDCTLRFALKYVSGIKENEEVGDELDAASFGNILHNVCEKLYEKHLNKVLQKADFDEMKLRLEAECDFAFAKEFGFESVQELEYDGYKLISKKILMRYVLEILNHDSSYKDLVIKGLEFGGDKKDLKMPIQIFAFGEEVSIYLDGYIDRVDQVNGRLRVTDYKTGQDIKKVESIESLFDRNDDKRNKAALQTFIYALMYMKKHGQKGQEIGAALYNLREMFNSDFNPHFQLKDPNAESARAARLEVVDVSFFEGEILNGLREILNEIFNPAIPFTQTEDIKKCEYCSFAGICKRK